MIQRLKPKSEFSKNVLTLMTGTTIAQVIPIAISPILTRIYTPEDFGVLALFVAITSIFGSIANGRYELAIMLPKKDENAINIFALGLIITFSMSFILLVLVVLFNEQITELLKNDEISVWLYFVPISVFFTGLYNILNYFNNRKKYYKDIANATIIKSIATAVIQLSIGLIKGGVSGLISGQLVSQIFANMRLFKNIIKDKVLVSNISKVKMILLAKRYKDFPKFSMPGILVNVSMTNITNILISSLYDITTLGYYSVVQRVINLPSSLIGGAIGNVYFQESSLEKQQTGIAIKSFMGVLKKLTIVGILPYFILFFVVEDIFPFIFGDNWKIAGEYAKIVIPLSLIRFIVSPISIAMTVFEKQKIGMYWQVSMFIISMSILFIAQYYKLEFGLFLYYTVIYLSLAYLVGLYICYHLSKGNKIF